MAISFNLNAITNTFIFRKLEFSAFFGNSRKNKINTAQLVPHAVFCFMVTLSSYLVKSNYFCMILNLLRLLRCQVIVFFIFTIQLLSIVTEKRGRKGQAKHHCTGIM